ncbi:MAG: P-loop NTPase [SAR324 cluster bacterium]|nr:P-loop NTPase [SAR324 cluster bacterium]
MPVVQFLRDKEIFAIGGGKGGTGKSFVASNLAIVLAKSNNRTLLIDADLGGANLHTCLGIPSPNVTLSDYIQNPAMRIEDVVVDTPLRNLHLISGAQDILDIANPKYTQKVKLLRAIQSLDVDFIVLDLGAGTNFNTLDFFLAADKGIMVVVPEPTSIENAYRFIKAALYRKLKLLASEPRIKEAIDKAMDKKNALGLRTPAELVEYVGQLDRSVGERMIQEVGRFRPRLVLNQVRSFGDVRIGYLMQNACLKYFGVRVDFLGYIENDDEVWQSIRKREPIALNGGYSRIAQSFQTIAQNLTHNLQLKPE